LHKNKTLNK